MIPAIGRAKEVLGPVTKAAEGAWDLAAQTKAPRFGSLKLAANLFNDLQRRLQNIVTGIAAHSVAMSKVAPRLARLSAELDQGARVQASKAADIADAAGTISQQTSMIAESTVRAVEYAGQVSQAMSELQESTRSIGRTMDLIRKVASQTRLLSLNAAVEAARAGEHGAGFAVVAGEVQSLADQTMGAAVRVEELLSSIGVGVEQLAAAMGTSGGHDGLTGLLSDISGAAERQEMDVSVVSADIEQIAAAARQQAEAVANIKDLGQQTNEHADNLLTSVGVFRFGAHHRAMGMVEGLAATPDIVCMQRSRQESAMQQFVNRSSVFELLYITDARGRQVTSNVAPRGFAASYGSSGHGQNWSSRMWYRGVAETGRSYVSDIYRSAATGDFCFTVSTPLRDGHGRFLGVLAADVAFARMLDQEPAAKALPRG